MCSLNCVHTLQQRLVAYYPSLSYFNQILALKGAKDFCFQFSCTVLYFTYLDAEEECVFYVGCLMSASYEITLLRLLVCPPITEFSQDCSISFFEIVHDYSWLSYLVIVGARFLRQKIWQPAFGANGPKSGPKLVFLPFPQVWFISFPWNWIQWKLATMTNI